MTYLPSPIEEEIQNLAYEDTPDTCHTVFTYIEENFPLIPNPLGLGIYKESYEYIESSNLIETHNCITYAESVVKEFLKYYSELFI